MLTASVTCNNINYTLQPPLTTQHHMRGRGLVGNTARDTPPCDTRRPRPTLGLYLLQEPLCRSTHPPMGVGANITIFSTRRPCGFNDGRDHALGHPHTRHPTLLMGECMSRWHAHIQSTDTPTPAIPYNRSMHCTHTLTDPPCMYNIQDILIGKLNWRTHSSMHFNNPITQ